MRIVVTAQVVKRHYDVLDALTRGGDPSLSCRYGSRWEYRACMIKDGQRRARVAIELVLKRVSRARCWRGCVQRGVEVTAQRQRIADQNANLLQTDRQV